MVSPFTVWGAGGLKWASFGRQIQNSIGIWQKKHLWFSAFWWLSFLMFDYVFLPDFFGWGRCGKQCKLTGVLQFHMRFAYVLGMCRATQIPMRLRMRCKHMRRGANSDGTCFFILCFAAETCDDNANISACLHIKCKKRDTSYSFWKESAEQVGKNIVLRELLLVERH